MTVVPRFVLLDAPASVVAFAVFSVFMRIYYSFLVHYLFIRALIRLDSLQQELRASEIKPPTLPPHENIILPLSDSVTQERLIFPLGFRNMM